MAQPKFIDIVRATGLRRYLLATAKEHNGVGWAMWQVLMKQGIAPYSIHKIMNIPRQRVDDLIKVYEEQHK